MIHYKKNTQTMETDPELTILELIKKDIKTFHKVLT
jgi:hypothetical protein